jgi:hypothetical protein
MKGMRADFILPGVLAAVLGGMTFYAVTASPGAPSLVTTPIRCEAAGPLGRLAALPEASGLANSRHDPRWLWAHNDSTDPYVYALGHDGHLRGRVRLAGASVQDWEAVTAAPCGDRSCLFVGDIGDNERARQTVAVYRVSEPAISEETTAAVTTLVARYPEGPQDAEAMFVADGRLFIVTKGEGSPVRLYRFPSLDASPQTLELVTTLMPTPRDKTYRVTDAALSPDERWVVLRTNDLLLFYDKPSLVAGTPGTPLSYDVRQLGEPQGEGIAWADAATLLLAGESGGGGGGTFARVSCTGGNYSINNSISQ